MGQRAPLHVAALERPVERLVPRVEVVRSLAVGPHEDHGVPEQFFFGVLLLELVLDLELDQLDAVGPGSDGAKQQHDGQQTDHGR